MDRGTKGTSFWAFCRALFSSAWDYVLYGGGAVILALWGYITGNAPPFWVWLTVIAAGFFLAAYKAWRDERIEADVQTRKLEHETRRLDALEHSVQYGLGCIGLTLKSDAEANHHWRLQFEFQLRNNLPNIALRYCVETEALTVLGKRYQGTGLPQDWHGLGPMVAQPYLGQRFPNVPLPRLPQQATGILEFTIRYALPGDDSTVSYRMMRKMELVFRQEGNLRPTLEHSVVTAESDQIVVPSDSSVASPVSGASHDA